MIDLTIIFNVVIGIAVFNILDILGEYLVSKIHAYKFKKRLSKLEYTYESWLGRDWSKRDCYDERDFCDEVYVPAKKPVKKTAVKKKTR